MFKLFIKRPVLAIIISLVILFLGFLSIKSLPTSQFPEIAPPRIMVSIAYPGASADVLVKSSLIPLERAINGVPGMKYIISDATSAGEATIQVIFELGTDPNRAVVNVKNRVDQVLNRLPQLVQLEGVIVNVVQPSMLMYVNMYSKDKDADEKFLYNFSLVNVIPEIQRVRGIASAKILGSRQYAMRIWLKPDRMRAYKVSTEDVMEAINEQSIIGRPGRLGQASGIKAQSLEYVLIYKGRYNKPEEYGDIIIRAKDNGEILHLKDVATIALGSEFFDIYSNKDGHPSAAIVLKQNYGSNASTVIEQVKEKMKELKETSFPPGMDYEINYDVSTFLDASIEKVLHTLGEAFVLVALVVFVFLGDWRSTLIPTLAVPVSLIGAFIFMQTFGLTINLITLFALVLAIGIVVDDAIVVVEAVHAKMEEENIGPYAAVQKVLVEIGGAIVAITLVMTSVFIPVAFMTGPVGIFYRQFSITMAASIVISALVALTLTPVLCAMILKNEHGKPKRRTPIRLFIDLFNTLFEKVTGRYIKVLDVIVNRRLVTFLMLVVFSAGVLYFNQILPGGFIPGEDQGMIYAIIQTPPGTTLEATNQVARKLQGIAEEVEGIQSVSSLAGYEILTEGRGSNAGTCLINLKDWSERSQSVHQIIHELEEKTKDFGAVIEYFEPPAVPGYGAADGFALRLLDKSDETDYHEFDRVNQDFMTALRKRKEITGLFTFYAANYPQYELIIDNKLAMQKGVSIGKAMDNLNILIGSTYEQGFIRFNNFFKVYTQASPEFRRYPSDILNYYVKNEEGEMVPYSAFMKLKKRQGPNEITRYNLYNSAAIRGIPAKGYTSADAIKVIQEVAKKTLPRGYDIAWEGLSFDEAARGNEALVIFLIVLFFVYLVLAAQYESFILPFAVLLSLPAGIFGSFFLLQIAGLANDIYAQVGLVMLVGLLGKNAVLIVEFAVQKHQQGMSILESAIEGARARFRPILMTSFAFIAGMVPLVIATGPGAIGNRTIGSSALGGMLFGTVFGVFLIPGLYYIFGTLSEGRKLIKDEDFDPLTETYEYNKETII
jgi:hydrophobic/amphiphilic exporter-1 (mainly G- bacteria), HAE1 family